MNWKIYERVTLLEEDVLHMAPMYNIQTQAFYPFHEFQILNFGKIYTASGLISFSFLFLK